VSRSEQYKMLIVLLVISLLIRLAFLMPVLNSNITETGDAYRYFNFAIGFQNILTDLLRGDLPSSEDMARAYDSLWPPLHPFLLSLGFLTFGGTLAVGRLMMVILSALTTPLVYLVTSKLSGKRVAFVASIIFATYPSFIHFSFRLLSETTYIFLLFLMLYFTLLTEEADGLHKKVITLAVVTGCLLGLVTLTRGTGLLWIPTVALWLGWRSAELKKRILLPTIILVSAVVTLLPWEIALFAAEDRFVMVATSSEVNLYYGNNPWLPEGYGTWETLVKPHMDKAAREYSAQHGVSIGEAYRALALQEITGDPVKFIRRGFYKFRILWSADFQLFRPPVGDELANLLFSVVLISFFAFLALVMWGLWNPDPALRHRELIAALVLAPMAIHLITIGLPKHNIPLLAALSPVAGHGLAYLKVFKKRAMWPWALATLVSVAIISFSIYTSLPIEYSRMEPSSYYLNLIRQLDQWFGHETMVSDRLLFRAGGDDYPEEVTISIISRDFEFADWEARTYSWKPSAETGILELVVRSQTAANSFQLQLSSRQPEGSAVLSLNREAWQTWQPSNLPGIEYMWVSTSVPISAIPGV
jgi:4-amino-4-deoxy-L-arabinose transferase-like glycosyltransferase